MTCQLSKEQIFIQKATRDFTRGEFDDDQLLDLIKNKQFPDKLLKQACKLDLVGLTFPESAGGQECGMVESVLVTEELCRRDSTAGIALASADLGAEVIAHYGTKDLVASCIRPLLKGEAVTALVSPELGDTQGPVTCEYQGEALILNGTVPQVLNAGIAPYFIVVAEQVKNGETKGQALAVVFRKTEGITVSDPEKKLGLDMTAWHRVSFDQVRISADNLITAPVKTLWQAVLLKMSAMYLGIGQGAFDLALNYARQREQFRRKIAQFQGISQKIADMYIRLQGCRSAVYAAARAMDGGCIDLHDMIATKLFAEAAAEYLTDESLQIHGGVGYMIEFPVEHFFRDVKCLRTLMGRKITQKDIVSAKVIGRLT